MQQSAQNVTGNTEMHALVYGQRWISTISEIVLVLSIIFILSPWLDARFGKWWWAGGFGGGLIMYAIGAIFTA